MRLHLLIVLAVINFVNAQYPVTYGCVAQIVAYMPMQKLVNFVNNLNKDDTPAKKKTRATNFIPKNIGNHQFSQLDVFSDSSKAVEAVHGLIDHRVAVGKFWNDLQPRLVKVFNQATAKKYKAMWAKTDKVYDNAFFDALNQWYAFCHYHAPAAKRTPLYNAIQAVTKKYVNDTKLNFEVPGSAFDTRFFLMLLFGMW
ncbi:unnamed protein product [Caenorhabditis bovis]|uniref:SXP/RAL-2 family protein Ani s 5-like cation-binding domain-containing protein n=1 Tax=Caenorhabditis bovis TaxID=2654633 RepID=A0A8S1F214_9PELO|nr:unnamed protein product [Caenorhabditis bovis]